MYPYINLFGLRLGTYGVCTLVGLALLVILSIRFNKKRFNIDFDDTFIVLFVCGGFGFIGAHILYGITNISSIIEISKNISTLGFFEYLKSFFNLCGGMVFYGGFIGAVLGVIFICKVYKPLNGHTKHELDVLSVTFPLFHVFGRIGCFFAGCCYGIESEFGFFIRENEVNPSITGVTRLPIQLIEAFLNLLIFFVMYVLFKKRILSDKLIYIYMIIYGTIRFIDEFFRGDTYRGILFSLSTSQWISLILIIFSVVMLIVSKSKISKKEDT